MDRIAYSAANVGFGTWIWRGREFSPHSLSSRSRRVGRQSASRPQSRLAGSPRLSPGDINGRAQCSVEAARPVEVDRVT